MKLKHIIIIFTLLALIAINYNQNAKANRPDPGSAQDPLVTKSFADQYISQAFGELAETLAYMETQIKFLKQRATTLENRLRQPVILTLGKKEAIEGDKIHLLAAAPYIKDGRTMLPFRFIGEIMDAQVNWDAATRTASYQLAEKIIEVTIDSKYAKINHQQIILDVAPELKDGSTMVPVRFITESLGAKIDWKPETKQIIIYP